MEARHAVALRVVYARASLDQSPDGGNVASPGRIHEPLLPRGRYG